MDIFWIRRKSLDVYIPELESLGQAIFSMPSPQKHLSEELGSTMPKWYINDVERQKAM